MDILFKNATILSMRTLGDVIKSGYVGVEGKNICYVGAKAPNNASEYKRQIDCGGKILMPGLVNAHTHTAMCLMRGYADDISLKTWLFDRVFPVERYIDERSVLAGACLGFAEQIASGTTSISDMYFFMPATAKLAYDVGIRASFSNALVSFDENALDFSDRTFTETEALIKDCNGLDDGRIRADISIHAEYTSHPVGWSYMRDLALKHDLNLYIHLSETKAEHDECLARRGVTPARAFYEHGVFDAHTTVAHGVWLSDEDMDILAQNSVSVAHCPVSNLKLGSGMADIIKLKKHGVNVALGTDGCCSNNTHDLFEEIKLAALVAKGLYLEPAVMSAYEALELATKNGAQAQRFAGGVIETGRPADIILISTDAPSMCPVYEPAAAAAYAANGRDVYLNMVNGRILYENGEFTTIDIEKTRAEIENYAVPQILKEQKL